MTEISDFRQWLEKNVDPEDIALSDDKRALVVHEIGYEYATGKASLGLIDPYQYSALMYGPADLDAERFDELVDPSVRKSIILEILEYYEHTGRIEWKRACKRFLSEETYADVFPT